MSMFKSHSCKDPFVRVAPPERAALFRFRQQHPPRTLHFESHDWQWIATGDGTRPVVLLHGMAGAYDFWWRIIEALQAHFYLVSLTYPPVTGLAACARGILAVMDAAGIERATFVGSSMGGYLAQYLATHARPRCQAAVLSNTFPPNNLFSKKNKWLRRLLPYLPERLIMAQMRRHTIQEIYPTSEHSELVRAMLVEQYCGRMRKIDLICRARIVFETFVPVVDPRLPVLIIESDNDPLVPRMLRERLKSLWAHASVYTLRGAGHFGYLNRPDAYSTTLRRFLERYS